MVLFHNFVCVPTYANQSQDNQCEDAEKLDKIFGAVLVINVVTSTLLNPPLIILKIMEKNMIGCIYATLGGMYFISNIVRGPIIIRKLLDEEYKETIHETPNTVQILRDVIFGLIHNNHQYILLLISSTRFVKCCWPFHRIRVKVVIAWTIFFNISTASLTFSKWFQEEKPAFFSLSQTIILKQSTPSSIDVIYVTHFVLSISMSFLSILLSAGAVCVIQRAPSLTEQTRVKKLKASVVVGLMSLFDLLYGLLNIATWVMVGHGSRYARVVLIFLLSVISFSFTAAFNPLLMLVAGYTRKEIKRKLTRGASTFSSQSRESHEMQTFRRRTNQSTMSS